MSNARLTLILLVGLSLSASSLAADPDAGKVKAEPCLACHFPDDFAGLEESAVLALIVATANPDSKHPPRNGELDEQDLADIAAFFARGE